MAAERFTGSFTQQEPIAEDAIEAAIRVMRSGRLHRYNLAPGEVGETGLLEQEFAAYTGARHCLAVASGGAAIMLALRAAGAGPDAPVLTNAFTLAPVPGAVAATGARVIFVETTDSLTIDLDDLAGKIGRAPILLLSHMRGHICDMDRLMAICDAAKVTVIEDCAHTMGARWGGTLSGRHGAIGCYSTQTYKHMNSGEGGLIVTDDADLMARMTLMSGSYMHFDRHPAGPSPDSYGALPFVMPNMSCRMDHLRAAILRPQLAGLAADCANWTARYRAVENGLRGARGISLIPRPPEEEFVGSSFQFRMPGLDGARIAEFVTSCARRGIELKWFGADRPAGFTSRYDHWRYAGSERLAATDRILATLLDMRLPLTFTLEDCDLIARIIRQEAEAVVSFA